MATCTYADAGTDATGDLGLYASTAGTVASDTSVSRTGPASTKLSTGNPAVTASFRTAAGVVTDAGSLDSFGFRIDTLPAARISISRLLTSGLNDVLDIQLNTNGTLRGQPIGATAVDGTTVLAVNTFYRISRSYTITNSTTFTIKIFLNGVLELTCNAGTMSTTGTSIWQGILQSGAGINVNAWFDDIYIDNRADLTDSGDVRVTAKRPFSNGTTNGFTTQIGSGGSGYGTGHAPQVNERPSSGVNGWSMIGAGSAVTEEYTIEGPTVGDVNVASVPIRGVFGWVRAKAALSETANIIVDGTATNISLTSSTAYFTKVSPNPTAFPGGGTDIGLITSTTVTTVSLFECGIYLAYTPIAPNFFLCL